MWDQVLRVDENQETLEVGWKLSKGRREGRWNLGEVSRAGFYRYLSTYLLKSLGD